MDDKNRAPKGEVSVEEILAEARILKESGAKPPAGDREPQTGAPEAAGSAREALDTVRMETGGVEKKEGMANPANSIQDENNGNTADAGKPEKRKRGLFGRFRRKSIPEMDEEDDLYYGLQLKPLEEYRREYEQTLRSGEPGGFEESGRPAGAAKNADAGTEGKPAERESDSSFPYLFGPEENGETENLSETFERVHRDRRERLRKIMGQAGLDADDLFAPEDALPPRREPSEEPGEVPEEEPGAPFPHEPAPPEGPRRQPEVVPGPARGPEIRPPQREPVYVPPRTPELAAEQPPEETKAAEARKEEPPAPKPSYPSPGEPVREPVSGPDVKEELPGRAPVREPGDGSRPEYRSDERPLHVIELEGIEKILSFEAERYPEPGPGKETPIPFPEPPRAPETPEAARAEAQPPEEAVPADTASEWPEADVPDETEGFLPGEEEEPVAPPRHEKKRFRLFGSEEPENEPDDEPPPEPDELDDYSDPADAPSVFHELRSNVRKLSLRLAVTGLCAAVAAAFAVAFEQSSLLPTQIRAFLGAQAFLIIQLVFLAIACVFSSVTIVNGFRSLFSLQANSDSAAAVAAAAAFVQGAVLLTGPEALPGVHFYSALACAALFLNTAGKLVMAKRIARNFRFVASPAQKSAVLLYDDYNNALRLSKGCVVGPPVIAYQKKSEFLRHFLSLSYQPDPGDRACQIMAPIGFAASLALCAAVAVLTKDTVSAVTAFTASACVCVPFANMLSVNLPVSRLCKIAGQCGSMLAGWPAVDRFSATNAVIVDAGDLFPKGTVVLNGIRTFGGQRIDDAILDATALMCAVGGPLSDLFDQIIKNRRELLPKLEKTAYEDGKGVSGWVSGKEILVGSRELMLAHCIEPPSRDYEEKYIRGGKKLVYLASGPELVAMFIVTYSSDRRRSLELRRMENNGISLIVRTSDPNVTPRFLAECFGLDEHSVRVLPESLGSVYTALVSAPAGRADALLATKGHRPTAMMRLLTGCVRQHGNISIAVALQTASAALGFALVAFLACTSGLSLLSATALLIYELFWTAAVLLVPALRRP
jgi:hypothetical protein